MTTTEEKYQEHSLFAEGSLIRGNITTKDSLALGGRVFGDLSSEQNVEINKSGLVEGNVKCDSLDLSGTVNGDVVAREVNIRKGAVVKGKLSTVKLIIHPDAAFIKEINLKETI
ncbi:MAG: polymer-forming cytoskeletal protein [Culturomica sp.]|jgi:cytoskeletal protein CcmA (bactofilin family)|nr:polymer-forming cytoskeletal protein [Culturomica sp.]